MVCPHCGSDTPAPGGMCTACKRSVVVSVLTATLTPIPSPEQDVTRLATSGTPTAGAPSPLAEGPLSVGESFGPRYRILKVLGAGGMGVVYQAWDEELGVSVALKVIRPEVMADPYAARELERRFKRELLLARQVTHKNVVRIHDLGEINGIKYLTMPFMDGRDLAHLLREQGRVGLARALRIARQIVAGLAAAHEAGVVHRDLKPENIMVDDEDHAVIMDFGISRSVSGTGTATATGTIVGTLEYMAPEQARGEVVDHRADLYAAGLILYDLIAGRHRIDAAQSAVAEMMARFTRLPPPLHSADAQVSNEVDAVVGRCLEPDAAKRYQSATDLLNDLESLDASGHRVLPPRLWERLLPAFMAGWPAPLRAAALVLGMVIVVVAVAAGIALVAGRWSPAGGGAAAAREPISIVVANFDNQARDPIFDGALEQALGIAIEGASFINAYPRNDALKFTERFAPGKPFDLERARLLSQREGIKIVLAGSIAPAGAGYELAVRAVDPIPGTTLAEAGTKARTKTDVLKAVGELASDLREKLGDTTPASARLAAGETFTASSLEAASEYSRAQDLAAAERHEEAIAHYRRATQLDQKFGRAYSGWALSADKLGRRQESAELFTKALGLLDGMTEREKLRTLSVYASRVERNYEQAIEHNRQLVSQYPSDGAGWNNLAVAYFRMQDFPKAFEASRKALSIYPKKILYRNNYALYAMYAGNFTASAGEARRIVAEDPTSHYAYLALAMAALAGGDRAGASAAYDGMEKAGTFGRSLSAMGRADLALYEGRAGDAERILTAGIALDSGSKNIAGMAAKYCALAEALEGQKRTNEAITAARKALESATDDAVKVPPARLLIRAGRVADARAVAGELAGKLQAKSRAFAEVLKAEIALREGRPVQAVDHLNAAQKLADVWLARYLLGIAYLRLPDQQASSVAQLEKAQERRGEITAAFPEDVPSFRYYAELPYWLARAQQVVGQHAASATNFQTYIKLRAGTGDPLVADAERRAATPPAR